jgi:CHAT domain-containing protein
MKQFYEQLKLGKTKDEALRNAQLQMIHSKNASHPFYWAAFTLNGDWR